VARPESLEGHRYYLIYDLLAWWKIAIGEVEPEVLVEKLFDDLENSLKD